MKSTLSGLLLCFCFAMSGPAAAADTTPVDVELVLAVDISRSMDPGEFAMQRAGYVDALRHPDFLNTVRAGLHGRIALTYFEWAGTSYQQTVVPWRIIDDARSAEAFAAELDVHPIDTFRGTSISAAIAYGATLFANAFDGERQVIDVSGDGPNNIGLPVVGARDAAVAAGITINGLPILIRPSQTFSELDRYYAECVVGGPGYFVLPIRDASEFATAIRRKLILEVSSILQAPIIRADAQEPVDCEKGERDRRLFSDPFFPELDK